jgi:PAS domain S-box-containing protein
MDRPIHILILEDNQSDYELVRRELRKAGFDSEIRWVQDRAAFLASLESFTPDIMLADYSLPGFDGVTALHLARQRFPEIPGIIVSGAIGEEVAIEALKKGATDYVLKQRLSRLGPVVRRALQEAEQLTDKKRAEQTLRESEERLRLMVEGVKDSALLMLDPQGRIATWNVGAQRLGGYTADEIIGQPFSRFYPPEDLAAGRPQRELDTAVAQGSSTDEGWRIRKDGSLFWASTTLTALRDPDGGLRGFARVTRDITERKRVEQERQNLLEAERAARSEAERLVRLKDEFLATVSHELRSPLGAIVGWTRLLANGKADHAKAVDIIARSASALTQLVEDLLDMSRILSGKTWLKRESVHSMELLTNAVETVRFAAEAKSIHIDVSFAPDLGLLECDPNRVQQVILNLLTNAIKFTDEGGCVMVAASQTHKDVIITVQDTGKGISPEFLPHLFERFRQEDGSVARRHGGLGLGLSIVKQLVELHGGTIQAESEGEGKGATFTVKLPRGHREVDLPPHSATPVSARAAMHALDLDKSTLHGVKVLCVDDDVYNRDLAHRTLTDVGATVRTAASAKVAFDVLDEFHPDIVLSDVGMPEEDGYIFIRKLRASGDWRSRLPCIAVTALSRAEDRKQALAVGYDEHVSKPFDPGKLSILILALTRRAPKPEPGTGKKQQVARGSRSSDAQVEKRP